MDNKHRNKLNDELFELVVVNVTDKQTGKEMYAFDPEALINYVGQKERESDVKARIDEHDKWKVVAEEIVRKDGVYRAVNYLNTRTAQLHRLQELVMPKLAPILKESAVPEHVKREIKKPFTQPFSVEPQINPNTMPPRNGAF